MNTVNWKCRPLVLFGAGAVAQHLIRRHFLKVEYFVDNDNAKQGTWIGNIPVLTPEQLCKDTSDKLVIVAVGRQFAGEIAQQLNELGFREDFDFALYQNVFPDELTAVRQISYLVNHRCNSRCMMCNIWQNNKHDEMSPDELFVFLSNPYFALVEEFLMTGGEPSLSEDLAIYATRVSEALPSLKNFSINVNGLMPERTFIMAREVKHVLDARGVSFFIAISLDGIGDVHDVTRGVPGAFKKAKALLNQLISADFTTQVSATVMKTNIWHLEEYLSFLRHNGVEAMFKLARESDTLNGGKLESDVNNYTDDELYQLLLFYHKVEQLCCDVKYTPGFRMYYKGVIEYLKTGARKLGCSFVEGTALHIKQDGKIHICANTPHAIALGVNGIDNLKADSIDEYEFTNFALCGSCISDCMATGSEELTEIDARSTFFNRFYSLDYFYSHRDVVLSEISSVESTNAVLITGWYGTETVGDKAILGQILEEISSKDSGAQILVTSVYPFVTKRTLQELKIENVEVVELFSMESLQWAATADKVVMGGGPLMEMEWLAIPLWLFSLAKAAGHRTVIWGCGIGPINTERGKKAMCEILELADEITLRDNASADYAQKLIGLDNIQVIDDPAVAYIRSHYERHRGSKNNSILACFLREITAEYANKMQYDEFIGYRSKFEKALADNIKKLCREHKLKPIFYSMHNFIVGGDDRDFNYRFVNEYFGGLDNEVYPKLTSIDVVTTAMREAELCLCMRFHSVAFADTLEAPYIAIDYTRGGKIEAFLSDNGKTSRMVSMDDISATSSLLCDRYAAFVS